MVGISRLFVKSITLRRMVRLAALGDARAIARVHVIAWQHAYQGILDRDFLGGLDLETRTAWWQSLLERDDGSAFVAEVDEAVVGFSLIGGADDQGWGEVAAIYVDPAHWGAGLGWALLASAEQRLADLGHHRASLWVLEANTRARHFYERQGWSLGRPIRLETIGGTEVTEVRYEKSLTPT